GSNIHNTNPGNVGVGTASPAAKLDVTFNGATEVGMQIFDTRPAGAEFGGHLLFHGYSSGTTTSARFGQIGGLKENSTSGSTHGFLGFYTNNGSNTFSVVERMRISSSGNVGVGTTNPVSLLNLVGPNAALTFGAPGAAEASSFTIAVAASGINTNNANGRNLLVKAGDSDNTAGKVGGDLILNPGAPVAPATGYGKVLLATGSGYVGVGTNAPAAKFDVAESGNNTTAARIVHSNTTAGNGLVIQTQTASDSDMALYVTSNAGAINGLAVRNSGKVGIGTVTPSAALHVVGDSVLTGRLGFGNNGWGAPGAVSFGTFTPYDGTFGHAILNNQAFGIDLQTAGATRLFVSNAGNVGLGTQAPAAKLHVTGDIRVDGNIAAKYQDVAEWVPSTQKLSAGTVVVVDPAGVNHVLASTAAYDTGVAGVVSAQPGLILGEGGEDKVKVATTGRVRVRVDATRAPIRAGDLLVTSGVPGVAMRSEPLTFGGVMMHRPGTIIGKALEPLEKGTGEILVLLSLQ
ncbi:MAG TPA: hypothetical protein VGV38_14050, partial [Pyrinomonadaceae bacterium]|nr:hypothetical protein [Pyrinomonadaceae bacterium]